MELEKFIQEFANQFDDTDASQITATTVFQELEEWSSLTTMMVIGFVKTGYNKNITGTEIRACQTVQDLFEFIEKK
ncbi:MAG: acyl carrier protein [Bacteroidales bacterium]|nr:acyl carrier protein [Bacteroidales bacterium]